MQTNILRSRAVLALTGLTAAAVLAACSSDTPAPTSLRSISSLAATIEQPGGEINVCKWGGPAGNYTFQISVSGGGNYLLKYGSAPTIAFDGTNPSCLDAYLPRDIETWGSGVTASVTFTELVPEGMQVDSIIIRNSHTGEQTKLTGTATATLNYGVGQVFYVKYFNSPLPPPPPPPPPAGFGCTPGYWKAPQHFDSWAATGLTTTQSVGSLFANASLYTLDGKALSNYTLRQALNFQGGETLTGAAEILLRAAVAAQLNARHPDVGAPLAAAAMIDAVNAALASGDRNTILSLATTLDNNNNAGCPLN